MTDAGGPRDPVVEEVTLLDEERDGTRFWLSASRRASGAVVIEGQDLGAAPRSVFGMGEYEYWIVVAPTDAEGVPLSLLRSRFSGFDSSSIKQWLDEESIPYEFHNRIGD